MAQYKDGESRTINGVTYVRTNGSWLPRAPMSPFATPTLPYEAPQARANLTGKTVENKKDIATLPYDVTSARNAATSSAIKVKSDQLDYNQKAGIPPGDLGKYGEDYLNSLPPGISDLTREMLAGKYKGSITNSRNPAIMQAALAAAHATHGNFDAGKYDERLALIKSLTDPNSQLGALNTALAHAGVLYDQSGDVAGTNFLGNNLASEGANALWNFWHGASPAVATYEGTVGKYGPEQAKAYGIGTGGERQGIEQQYSVNLPLDTKQALLANDAKLYAGKIASIAHGYDMLGGNSPLDYLSPDAKAALQQINPDVYRKIFGATPLPGGNQPPPSGPSGPGFSPPPTGSTNGGPLTPSDQFNTTPDPQSAQFWSDAAHNQVPYRTALARWQSDVQQRGLVGQTPPPPEAYNRAATYIQRHPNIPYQPFSSVTKTPIAPVQQDVQNAVNGAIFSGPGVAVGHALNAATANVPTLLAGDNGARYNAISSGLHGNYALGGDIAGTVGGAAATGFGVKAAAPALGKFGALLAGNPARAALTGDSLFLGGSGAAQNPDNPVGGAALGAASALTGNLLGRYVVGPGMRVLLDTNPVQKGVNAVGGMFGRSFNPPAAIDPGQSMILKRANDLDAIRTNLTDAANFNLPYTLADANPKLRALAGSAARKSPDVLTTAENVLGPRQQGQAERAIAQLNNLAPVGDVPTLQGNILKSAQTQSAPLYADAKAQPTPDLIANPALQDVLNRPAAQAAIRNGYNTALNNGEDVGTLSFGTDANGNPVQFGNPSWNVIHYTRQALDNAGETSTRQALDKQISTLNPGFKAADAKYAGVMKGSDALQAGSDASAIRVTPEATQAAMDAFSKSNNLPLFQQGYTSNLADMIERQRLSGNPYNLVNGSLGQQSKLASVFPQGAPNFLRAQGLEGDMGKTYQEVLGGSQTAARTAADKAFDNAEMATDIAMAPATHGASLAGLLMTGARKGLGYLGDRANIGINTAKANAMAPYLFNPDPAANLDLLNQINLQAAQRRAYLQNFGAVTGNVGAGMFGAPIVYGASQN